MGNDVLAFGLVGAAAFAVLVAAFVVAWALVPEDIRERIFDALHKPDTEWVEAAIRKAMGE